MKTGRSLPSGENRRRSRGRARWTSWTSLLCACLAGCMVTLEERHLRPFPTADTVSPDDASTDAFSDATALDAQSHDVTRSDAPDTVITGDTVLVDGVVLADALDGNASDARDAVVTVDAVDASHCGGPGQPCCFGFSCTAPFQCLDWGIPGTTSTPICGPCGAPGEVCCPSFPSCAAGAYCTVIYNANVPVCITDSDAGTTPGSSCTSSGANYCGRPDLACVFTSPADVTGYCMYCGSPGRVGCWGDTCPFGGTNVLTPSGVDICQ